MQGEVISGRATRDQAFHWTKPGRKRLFKIGPDHRKTPWNKNGRISGVFWAGFPDVNSATIHPEIRSVGGNSHLTGGRPMNVDHIMTAMLMALVKPRGEAMRSGVSDEYQKN